MYLGEEVGKVVGAWTPVEVEFAGGDAVLDPVVPHGYHFRSTGFAGFGEDLAGDLVVVDDHGCGLGVAKVLECLPKMGAFEGGCVDASDFCFGDGVDDVWDDGADDLDGAVDVVGLVWSVVG